MFEQEVKEREEQKIRESFLVHSNTSDTDTDTVSVIPILFSDDRYRLFIEDNSSKVLLYNFKGEAIYKNTSNVRLKVGSAVLVMDDSEGYSYENSITQVLLENPEIKKMYDNTQVWREELKRFCENKGLSVHRLKLMFDTIGLVREELTIKNWMHKSYQFSTLDYKKEIPLIFKTIESSINDNRIQQLLSDIKKFMSLRFSIGRFFRRILLETEVKGDNTFSSFETICSAFLSKRSIFKQSDPSKLVVKLFEISKKIKILEIVDILSKIKISSDSELLKRPIDLKDIQS